MRGPFRGAAAIALGAAVLVLGPVPVSEAGVPTPRAASAPCDGGPGPAGVPDPSRSKYGLSAGAVPCQYRFWADGGLDILTVNVTLLDAFDNPLDGATAEVNLRSASGNFCSCEGTVFRATTDPDGVGAVSFSRIGGWGDLELWVTAEVVCTDQSLIRAAVQPAPTTITFTSADLDASCETPVSANIIDLGWFAVGLNSYILYADYDCNGIITIVDLGIWAHALDKGCGP